MLAACAAAAGAGSASATDQQLAATLTWTSGPPVQLSASAPSTAVTADWNRTFTTIDNVCFAWTFSGGDALQPGDTIEVSYTGVSGIGHVNNTSTPATEESVCTGNDTTRTAAFLDGSEQLTVSLSPGQGQSADTATLTGMTVTVSTPGDVTAPATVIDSGPADGSYTNDASASANTFSFHATDPDSSSFTYSCTLDGTTAACSSPFTPSAALTDGSHTFSVAASDGTNTDPTPPTRTWTVDTVAPTSSASAGSPTRSSTISVAYTAADDSGGSGLASVDLYARGPGDAAYSKVATDATPGASGSFDYTAGGDGTYAFYTVATDRAGNAEPAPATADASVLLDSVAPSSRASGPGTTNNSAFTVAYTASDASPSSGLASVALYAKGPSDASYALADTDSSPAASGHSFSYAASEGDGSYRFYTIATDAAGNAEAAPTTPDTSVQVSSNLLDTVPPVTSDDAPAGWSKAAVTVHLQATDSAPAGATPSGVKDTFYALDPSSCATASYTSGTSVTVPAPSTHANDGTHTVCYYSTDNAGNAEAPKTATVRIDTQAPSTSSNLHLAVASGSTAPPSPAERNNGNLAADVAAHGYVSLPLSATDPASAGFGQLSSGVAATTWSVDGGAQQTGTSVHVPAAASHADDGWHTVSYASSDNAGNAEPVQSTGVYVDTTAPSVQIDTTEVGAKAAFTFHAVTGSDPDDPTGPYSFECKLDGGAGTWGTCSSGDLYQNLDGTYSFHVRALDGAGNAGPEQVFGPWTASPGNASVNCAGCTVTSDPGSGATKDLPTTFSATIPALAGSSSSLAQASALPAAGAGGASVTIQTSKDVGSDGCGTGYTCVDPDLVNLTIVPPSGSTPVYTFVLTVDGFYTKNHSLKTAKVFHNGDNVPNCTKSAIKTGVPNPSPCIRSRATGSGGDWVFTLISFSNGKFRA